MLIQHEELGMAGRKIFMDEQKSDRRDMTERRPEAALVILEIQRRTTQLLDSIGCGG